MSDAFGPERVAEVLSTDLDRAVTVAMAAIVAAGVGYAGGGVLAGEPVREFVPLLAFLAFCSIGFLVALYGSE